MDLPKTLHEAVDYFLPFFYELDGKLNESENNFIEYCQSNNRSGIGTMMRNKLDLWNKNSELYNFMVDKYKIDSPIEISMVILREIYKENKIIANQIWNGFSLN